MFNNLISSVCRLFDNHLSVETLYFLGNLEIWTAPGTGDTEFGLGVTSIILYLQENIQQLIFTRTVELAILSKM